MYSGRESLITQSRVRLFESATDLITGLLFVCFLYSFVLKVPSIGGPDFFFYILTGRDLSDGFEVGIMHYFYFPGIYWFWKYCFDLFGHNLLAIQSVYVGVLLLSSVFSAACVYLLTRKKYAAFLAGSMYIILLHILEGWGGVIEPIATLFMLLGLLFYLYFYQAQKYLASALSIVVFFGLCLFMKQQGIFFIAASAVLPFSELKRFFQINKLTFLVPISAGLFVFGLILLEGGGLEAIRVSLSMAVNYSRTNTLAQNLSGYFMAIFPVFVPVLAFLMPIALFALIDVVKSKKKFVNYFNLRFVIFLMFAGILPLYQFKVREYLHYGIYTVPALVILSGWAIASAFKWLAFATKTKKILVLGLSVFFLFVSFNQHKEKIDHVHELIGWLPPHPLDSDIAKLSDVCSHLHGPNVLLLPPRVNTFHWICNTRSASGKWAYSWYEEAAPHYFDIISQQFVTDVFVFDKNFGDFEERVLSRPDWADLEKHLKNNNYSVSYSNSSGRLYKKNSF